MNDELMKDAKYFSKVTCDCGCDNFMPQHRVDKGQKYLHGHKPKGGHHITPKPKAFSSTKAIHLQAGVVNLPSIKDFAADQVKNYQSQLEVLNSKIKDLDEKRAELIASHLAIQEALESWEAAERALNAI